MMGKMASSPPPASPAGPSTEDFEAALASHVDESKPDPLARRQMENIVLQWEPSPQQEQQGQGQESSCEPKGHDAVEGKQSETKEMCGAFTLFGEYMSVSIRSNCSWKWQPCGQNDGGRTCACAHASLSFRLMASARFIPQSQHKRLQKERLKRTRHAEETADVDDDKSPKVDRKEQRAQTKIRAGMIDRLKQDFYVKRLLDLDGDSAALDGKGDDDQVLLQRRICEAEIKESFDSSGAAKELEERVDVSEDALEGIRRAVLSQLDDNTSVLDLLLAFPYLINTQIDVRKDSKGNDINLQLGHRAILRLLEDACIDACEKEGEDELLDDLRISKKGQGEGDDGWWWPRHKRQRYAAPSNKPNSSPSRYWRSDLAPIIVF